MLAHSRRAMHNKLEYHDSLMHATHLEKHLIAPNHNMDALTQTPNAKCY